MTWPWLCRLWAHTQDVGNEDALDVLQLLPVELQGRRVLPLVVHLQAREQGDLSEKIQGELLKVRTPPQARCISIYKVSFTPILGLF